MIFEFIIASYPTDHDRNRNAELISLRILPSKPDGMVLRPRHSDSRVLSLDQYESFDQYKSND